jgi:hypothetical protein
MLGCIYKKIKSNYYNCILGVKERSGDFIGRAEYVGWVDSFRRHALVAMDVPILL